MMRDRVMSVTDELRGLFVWVDRGELSVRGGSILMLRLEKNEHVDVCKEVRCALVSQLNRLEVCGAVDDRPRRLPFWRALARPSRVHYRRIFLANSANIAIIPVYIFFFFFFKQKTAYEITR